MTDAPRLIHVWSDASLRDDRRAAGMVARLETGEGWFRGCLLPAGSTDANDAELSACVEAVAFAVQVAAAEALGEIQIAAYTDNAKAAGALSRYLGDWRERNRGESSLLRALPNQVYAQRLASRERGAVAQDLRRLSAVAAGVPMSITWSEKTPEIRLCDSLARRELGLNGRTNLPLRIEEVTGG